MKHSIRDRKGFTLLELLVTVVIIAVLTIIGIVSYASVNKRSRDVKRKSDLEQIRSALEMYRSDNGDYPASGTGDSNFTDAGILTGTLARGTNSYIPVIPTDPNGSSTYFYASVGVADDTGRFGSYCVCGCLESAACDGTTIVSDTCSNITHIQSCNYYLKSP